MIASKNTCMSGRRDRRAAFTLMELAIVLAVAGAIIGAIWVAAVPVWENKEVADVQREVMTTVSNIRDNYASIIIWPWTAGSNKTSTFGAAPLNLLPAEISAGGVYRHALGGSFAVLTESDPVSGKDNAFRIKLQGLKQSACIKLVTQLPLSDPTIGIVQLFVNNTATAKEAVTAYGNVPTWSPSLPVSVSTATGWCDNSATVGPNEVDLDFRLHP